MTGADKLLYHQIHPIKLLTDLTTSFASASLLWQRAWVAAAVVAWAPSIVVTLALVWCADLERYRDTPFGRYVAAHMTGRITAVRLAGQIVMWIGAAVHVIWLVPAGFAVVVFAWMNGIWTPQARSGDLSRGMR